MSDAPKRTWKVWLFYLGGGLCFSLLFLYLTFPWEALRQRLEAELSTALSAPQSPAQVSIGGVHGNWFTGVVLEKVMLARTDPLSGLPRAALLPELRLRISLLGLLKGERDVTFSARALGGQLEGNLLDGKKQSALTVSGSGLQLADARDLLAFFGSGNGMDLGALDLSGVTSLKGDLSFKPNDFASLKGHLTLGVEHALIKGGTVADYDLPQVDLGRIDLQAHAQEGKLDIERFKIDGPDVTVESDAMFLTLNQNLAFSMPHGKVRLHLGDDLQKRIPYLGMGLSAVKQPDRDGFYVLPLAGTLRSPKLM